MTPDKARELAESLRAKRRAAGERVTRSADEHPAVAQGHAQHPARPRRASTTRTRAIAAAEKAGAWAAWKKSRPEQQPRRSHAADRPMPACAAAAARATRRPRSGASRAAVDADVRYVVANGFEADPGAQVDRTLMERDPHAIVEGVALAAYATGATRAYMAVRENQTTALRRLSAAVRAAEEAGYLGSNALGVGLRHARRGRRRARRHGRRRGDDAHPRHREQARPARPAAALPGAATGCGAGRRWSTTSRRLPWCRGSWPTAPPPSPKSATTHYPGTTLVQITGAVAKPGHRRGAAGHVPAQAARPQRQRTFGCGRQAQGGAGGRAGRRVPAARPSSTRCTRRRRWRRAGAVVGLGLAGGRRRLDVHRRHGHAARCASCRTSRAARRSRAASACAGCTSSASARRPAFPSQPTPRWSRRSPPTCATAPCAGSRDSRPIRS